MQETKQLPIFIRKLLIVIIAAIGLYLIYLSRDILAKLGISILLMVILDPLVKFFMRYMPRKSRLLAIIVTFTVLGLILLLVLARFVPIVSEQFSAAVEALNNTAAEAQKSGQSLSEAIADNNPTSSINALVPYIAQAIPAIVNFIVESLSSIFSSIFAQLMVFGFVFFGLIEGPRMLVAIKRIIPIKNKADIIWYAKTGYRATTTYITGNLFISLCAGIAAAIFCLVLGIPYAGLMLIAVAICDLIPMVGSYLSGIVLGLFAWLFVGVDAAIAAAIFVLIYQQFENNILSPLVYKESNKLSPFTVLVAVSLGGAMFGMLGALIAIPVGSTVQLGIERYLVAQKR
jgi:predicted PurR-regulated permease PerM